MRIKEKNVYIQIVALVAVYLAIICGPAIADWVYAPQSINSYQNPGQVDPHTNSGGRRIARINNTTVVIAPHISGQERTYRSTDNGLNWQEIDQDGAPSGTIISGPEQFIYHFYLQAGTLYMVKFRYDDTPPSPLPIYSNPDLSTTETSVYRAVNATVDESGRLFVAAHWGDPDQIYILRSDDGGGEWLGPYQLSAGHGPWFYPHLDVTASNVLVATYHNFDYSNELWFARSIDRGEKWQRILVADDETNNPSILTVGEEVLFIFAQSSVAERRGLVFNYSVNSGNTWSGWQLIDSTCGYADPSPALGNDGHTIYVAFRSSNGTGVEYGTCGDRSRSRLARSSDFGQTWEFVDNYYNAERTGTRNQTRYQTWWNYGGPLEWIWMQYEDDGANRPIYYDVNIDVQIYNSHNVGNPPVDIPDGGTEEDVGEDDGSDEEEDTEEVIPDDLSSSSDDGESGDSCFVNALNGQLDLLE